MLMLVVLFLGYLAVRAVVPAFQEAVAQRERLEVVSEEQLALKAELEELKKAEIKRRDEICGFWENLLAKPMPGNACKAAEEAVEEVEDQLAEVEQRIDQAKAEEGDLREAQESGPGWLVDQWDKVWRWLLGIALLAIFLPPVVRIVSYVLLMPLVTATHKRIRLTAASEHGAASLHAGPAERTLTLSLAPGQVLSVRSQHLRPVRGTVKGRLLYDWTAPFISFAAGLYGLSRVIGDEEGTEATLATPDDPDSYLMRIDFADHPGLVMHPRHLVGVIGTPELETRWRWGVAALATWQVRYIMFVGTGSLIVQGSGNVEATSPGDRPMKMEQNLVMGFDSRLSVGVSRTEVFWPYFWGSTPLVDDEFTGPYPYFWQKSSDRGPTNPIVKAFNALFSALGKLLGF
ncbi:hypothetical protein [Nocardioides euryhalodurans]|uniref:hypothetical protein n=1 Tax=Nocardioides euryhalodurans TaxID=2518370 RepID=UPI00142463E4|nr:hypothetical protein [Nocardioides euryhalodurans]